MSDPAYRLYNSIYTLLIISVCITICFCMFQIRGCQRDHIELLEQKRLDDDWRSNDYKWGTMLRDEIQRSLRRVEAERAVETKQAAIDLDHKPGPTKKAEK